MFIIFQSKMQTTNIVLIVSIISECEKIKIWKYENMKIWKYENMKIWKFLCNIHYGNKETQLLHY
jgi:hypothetical protein